MCFYCSGISFELRVDRNWYNHLKEKRLKETAGA